MTSDIKRQVRDFIANNFMMGGEADFGDEASFVDNHIIDSTGFLELIMYLEETFHIQVADAEMVPDNLDSLSNIERYVQRKCAAA